MSYKILDYALDHGYINHWLVAGPLSVENAELSTVGGDQASSQMTPFADIFREAPVDRGKINLEDQETAWHYYRCQPDHLVSVSDTALLPQSGWAWAAARLIFPQELQGNLRFFADTLAEIWVNGVLVGKKETTGKGELLQTGVKLYPDHRDRHQDRLGSQRPVYFPLWAASSCRGQFRSARSGQGSA